MKNITVGLLAIALCSVASAQSLFTGNVIKNGSFEAGATSVAGGTVVIPDWNGLATVGEYGINNWWEVPAGAWSDGIKFAGGGNNDLNSIDQLFEISGDDFAAVDSGASTFNISGWFGGWTTQEDFSFLTADFLDASNTSIANVVIGNVTNADRGGVTSMLFREANGTIAAGTRSIRFTLTFDRIGGGTYNDGSADNLQFTADAVPEPMTMIVLAAGAALAAARRRSK